MGSGIRGSRQDFGFPNSRKQGVRMPGKAFFQHITICLAGFSERLNNLFGIFQHTFCHCAFLFLDFSSNSNFFTDFKGILILTVKSVEKDIKRP